MLTSDIDISPKILVLKRPALVTGVTVLQWVAAIFCLPVYAIKWFSLYSNVDSLYLLASSILSLAVMSNLLIYKQFRESRIYVDKTKLGDIQKELKAQGFELRKERTRKLKYNLSYNAIVRRKAVIHIKDSYLAVDYPAQLDEVFEQYKKY